MDISVKIKTKFRKFIFLAYCGILCGCSQFEIESFIPDNTEMDGDPVEIRISLSDTPVYGATAPESRSGSEKSSTRDRKFLITEWVKPEHFSLSRSGEDDEESAIIAAMELSEDTDTTNSSFANTRTVMTAGYNFRMIVFKKVGDSYVYQGAADYTANGANAPVLKRENMGVFLRNQTYRFMAYSFNNNTDLGNLPSSYTWDSSVISIPNLDNDFMTFDSGDKVVTGKTYSLAIDFTHQLCKLTIKINAVDIVGNTSFSNCTGVRVNQGGNSSSWTIGQASIAANTNNTANFNIPDNSTATVRVVPFSGSRSIGVYFNTLTIIGKSANGTTVTSSQTVQLLKGQSYTMAVQFKPKTIKVPKANINLGSECTDQDKTALANLSWANGNLKSTGSSDYEWTTPSDYGYYYTGYSTYTGDSSSNNTDPCSKLTPSLYGSGWRTPTQNEIEMLMRCTDKVIRNGGTWFMNASTGLFLPAAGDRGYTSGLEPEQGSGTMGRYWSSAEGGPSGTARMILEFQNGTNRTAWFALNSGCSVRCVATK